MTAATTEVASDSYGYHPLSEYASDLISIRRFASALVLGREVPDLGASISELRVVPDPDVRLPRGVYWFPHADGARLLIVNTGALPAGPSSGKLGEVTAAHPLMTALQWFDELWPNAKPVATPRFAAQDAVVTQPSGQDAVVLKRTCQAGRWSYAVRINGAMKEFSERNLAPQPMTDDPSGWVRGEPVDSKRFAATLTRAKLSGELTDMVFSYRATRTLFRPYQFKPVMKLLATGKLRLLIADEVGLGKTIEAGLVWTELEARKLADRALVLCPSSLVPKWKREMEERFGFVLQELDTEGLNEMHRRVEGGRLPPRVAYICSFERMRKWEELESVTNLGLKFDVVIVDEAHAFRNLGTASHALGLYVSEWAEALVFLTATPLNLKNEDLYNLLNLLSPGEFGNVDVLESQLEPTAILNRIAHSLLDAEINNARRLQWLQEIRSLTFGEVVTARTEFGMLSDLLHQPTLDAAAVVRARRLIAALHALSAVINRTRKAEIQEDKAVREAQTVDVRWTSPEQAFYDAFREWCVERAKSSKMPLYFAMQMPLRLASTCLPMAARQVLDWQAGGVVIDEDTAGVDHVTESTAAQLVAPSSQLRTLAADLAGTDSKFDSVLPVLRGLADQGKRALLFTFSRPTLNHLRARLAGQFRVAVLHGGVPHAERHEIMAAFRRGEYDLLLANRVASEGLDFEFCSAVINYDLPWNPMEVEQRIGRIDRIGQCEKKIYVVNFRTPGTIESDIFQRLMDRVGVFESSIGELEPIVREQIVNLQRVVYDFALSDEQRELKTREVLAAIEERELTKDEVESASAYLLSSDGVDIDGFEAELVGRGRYVGQDELALLLADWMQTAEGSGRISRDGKTLRLRGNAAMAQDVRGLANAKERSHQEIESLVSDLLQEVDIHLSLDQDAAREGGPDLLTANHPLVRAALRVPGHRQSRFASVRLPAQRNVRPGQYLVYMTLSSWAGLRPRNEIWAECVNLGTGESAPSEIGDLLLSQLAGGQLRDAALTVDGVSAAVERLERLMSLRRDIEEDVRVQENEALLESRRISIREVHERKIATSRMSMATLREKGQPQYLHLFEGKLRREALRLAVLEQTLDEQGRCGMSLEPLAVCLVEVIA